MLIYSCSILSIDPFGVRGALAKKKKTQAQCIGAIAARPSKTSWRDSTARSCRWAFTQWKKIMGNKELGFTICARWRRQIKTLVGSNPYGESAYLLRFLQSLTPWDEPWLFFSSRARIFPAKITKIIRADGPGDSLRRPNDRINS